MSDTVASWFRWPTRLRMDLSPLRTSRDFRRLFLSRLITLMGSQVTEVALLIQVKDLTGDPLAVGLLGVAQVVPVIVFSLYGGLLADRVDRRTMALWCEVGLALITFVLVVNALAPQPALWPLYVAAAGIMSLAALQRPSLDAAIPRVVTREQLPASSALMSMAANGSAVLGPAIGGLLLAGPGAVWAYGIDTASFVLSFLMLLGISALPRSTDDEAEPAAGLAGVLEGVTYAVRRRDLLGSYLVDLAAMTFAIPLALLPFMATELQAEWAQGLLFSAGAVGALIASAASGWTSGVHRHGRAIAISAALWGAAMIGVGFSGNIYLALAFLVFAGGADMYSGMFRDVLWNSTIPDAMRGRLAGLEVLSYGLGPVAGQVRGGAVAAGFGARVALWSGGLACVAAVGLICRALPRLWTFDDRVDAVAQPSDEGSTPGADGPQATTGEAHASA